jgi:uncharacterized membrane protein HdeD (DUF308 family)
MWAAAARRFLTLLGITAGVVAAASALLGLLLGTSVWRSVSVGFYLVGSFLLVAGFFMGNRGPTRLRGEPGEEGIWGLGRKKGVRLATADERRETLANTAIFVTLGVALIVVGVVADSRYDLY